METFVRKPRGKFKHKKLKKKTPPRPISEQGEGNMEFLQEFHDDVVKRKRTGTDPETGKEPSMLLGTVGADDKTYILPHHDPETRTRVSPRAAMDKFDKALRSGELTGYDSVEEAEDELHAIRQRILAKPPKKKRRRR